MPRLATWALLALLGGVPAGACALEVVRVVTPEEVRVRPGTGAQIMLHVVVRPGYHVQANPVENPSLIPITLGIEPVDHMVIGSPQYPAAKRLRLEGDERDLVVYDGRFAIALPVEVASAAAGTRLTLTGSLRYQACDDRHCLFPVTLPVTIPVTVGAP